MDQGRGPGDRHYLAPPPSPLYTLNRIFCLPGASHQAQRGHPKETLGKFRDCVISDQQTFPAHIIGRHGLGVWCPWGGQSMAPSREPSNDTAGAREKRVQGGTPCRPGVWFLPPATTSD